MPPPSKRWGLKHSEPLVTEPPRPRTARPVRVPRARLRTAAPGPRPRPPKLSRPLRVGGEDTTWSSPPEGGREFSPTWKSPETQQPRGFSEVGKLAVL